MASLPIFVPPLGTMVGAVLGCFAGATLIELAMRKKLAHGAKVGVFSAIGYALGTAAKVAIALVMSALLLTSALCSHEPAGHTDEASTSLSLRTLQFGIKDHPDLGRAWNRPFVVDLRSLDDFAVT